MRLILEERVTDPSRFEIASQAADQELGEGRNELTIWSFYLPVTKDSEPDPHAGFDVARLELCLTPRDQWISNDSVRIYDMEREEGLPAIHLDDTGMLPHLELDRPVCCNFDLLQVNDGQAILDFLLKHKCKDGYCLPMVYQEDATIHDAHIRLEQWQGSTRDWRARVRVIVDDTRDAAHFAWCLGFEE